MGGGPDPQFEASRSVFQDAAKPEALVSGLGPRDRGLIKVVGGHFQTRITVEQCQHVDKRCAHFFKRRLGSVPRLYAEDRVGN